MICTKNQGYLLLELMCALLIFCMISSVLLRAHWNTITIWKNALQERKAVQLAQQHLHAALHGSKKPIKNKNYTVTTKNYSCFPTVTQSNQTYDLENLNKHCSLTCVIVAWKNSHGKERSISLVSSRVVVV